MLTIQEKTSCVPNCGICLHAKLKALGERQFAKELEDRWCIRDDRVRVALVAVALLQRGKEYGPPSFYYTIALPVSAFGCIPWLGQCFADCWPHRMAVHQP
jgi:hypothetical protein